MSSICRIAGFYKALVLGLSVCSVTLCMPALSQQVADLEQGYKPYGSYHGGNIDQVSMTNGNLILRIPLTSFAQRGRISNDEILTYSAKNYATTQQCTQSAPGGPIVKPSCTTTLTTNGPDFGATLHNVNDVVVTVSYPLASSGDQNLYNKLLTVESADGGNHQLGYVGSASTLGYGGSGSLYRALDGSGYAYLDSEASGAGVGVNGDPGTLWFPNGNSIQTVDYLPGESFPTHRTIVDPDGNRLDASGDTLGRVATTQILSSAQLSICPSIGNNLNQPVSTATTETYADGSAITFCYANVNLNTHFALLPTGNGNDTVMKGPTQMLQSVVLQDRVSYWGFLYDSANLNQTDSTQPDYYGFGELQKLILPTGGYIS